VSRVVRLGAVSYLNVRPLVYGLERYGEEPTGPGLKTRPSFALSLRFDVPSVCAELLDRGDIDLGMVPSIAHLDRPGDRIVPGVCIGSEGPVASVALFTRRPMRDVHSIALDTSSRTSAALTRILCARRFDIAPTFVAHSPDLDAMLATADAALLIGDLALFADPGAAGAEKIDLGAEWTTMTGLPFVWAFWAGRPETADDAVDRILQDAAREGMAHTDEIADAYCASDPARRSIARRYLRENLRFELDDRAMQGLRLYYREATALGLTRPPVRRPDL
jgi:predicted solute-binding protein